MLNKIKSTIISKKVFSFINESIKLKLVKYNKSTQKKLNINIINYKYYQGKYIIYETKTKAKEYDYKNKLLYLYEGDYLNGERNGKGKEYNNDGELIFDGEYLNGKRNGKGKEYDYNSRSIFEGEYSNGEKNGKGKEYINDYRYCNKTLIFDGEYLKGKRWSGKVKEYDKNNKLIFEGEYLNGEKNGECKEYDEHNNLMLEYVFFHGKKCFGYDYKYLYCFGHYSLSSSQDYIYGNVNKKYKYNQEIFKGEYKNGKPWNGNGYDNKNKVKYELKNGTRREYDENNKLTYEGDYLDKYRHGRCKEYKNGELIFDCLLFKW